MEKNKLKKMLSLTATNFKFKLDEDFSIFFDMIYEKVKNIPDELITKRFQQLWLTSNEDWNKKYGYAGYPSFSDWLFILTGNKPLTDIQIEQERKRHEDHIKYLASKKINSISEDYGNQEARVFVMNYFDPEREKERNIIDNIYEVNKKLTEDEAKNLCLKIRKDRDADFDNFKKRLLETTNKQNQLLLN